ncbi:hypothetical protein L2W42_00125 [Rhizobium gallicum]|nr:hypothetical protein [Rhizobium gallicum]ULJ72207.1 hypothetical protein L2W42_00125 [Rhizobium gallicum]
MAASTQRAGTDGGASIAPIDRHWREHDCNTAHADGDSDELKTGRTLAEHQAGDQHRPERGGIGKQRGLASINEGHRYHAEPGEGRHPQEADAGDVWQVAAGG